MTDEDYEKKHRFVQYIHSRFQSGETDKITQELDYLLERNLGRGSVTPEQRYQVKKREWFSHNSSTGTWYVWANKTRYDNEGCCSSDKCVPECRFYQETGRIEDDEIIAEHQKYVDKLRQENKIIKAPF